MFKHAVIASYLLLGAVAAGLMLFVYLGKDADRLAYQRLMNKGSVEDSPTSHQVKQKREKVAKDLFFADFSGRLHMHMEGDKADLLLHREEDQTVLMETLQPFACAFQEELMPENHEQSVVWFDASQAHLNYRTQTVRAEAVSIARFRMTGNLLPEKKPAGLTPILEGSAGAAELTWEENRPKILVKTFKGQTLLEGKESKIAAIEADEATYEAGKLRFIGAVQVSHPLGILKASKMELSSEDKQGSQRYTHAFLEDNVDINLHYGGHLHCAQAMIDSLARKATFKHSSEDREVVYTDVLLDRKGDKVPLLFKSKTMLLELDSLQKGSKPRLSHLSAESDVSFNYNGEMTLTADHADYLYRDEYNGKKTHISGFIILKSSGEGGVCQLTNLQGDYIRAERIEMNTLESTAVLFNPVGEFQTVRADSLYAPMTFKAAKMTLDHSQDVVTLEKDVLVKDSEYGTIETSNLFTMRRTTNSEGKKSLHSITSTGRTVLTHTEAVSGVSHKISCLGSMKLDHSAMTFECSSTPGDTQVVFEDEYGEVKAKQAALIYRQEKGRMRPYKLILDGHLQVINRTQALDAAHPVQLQYALADHAEYFFETKEMTFSSKAPKKVLLYDKSNHIEISASALKIKRDAVTKKDSITGQGDVRFHLVEHELNLIKNHFRFDS